MQAAFHEYIDQLVKQEWNEIAFHVNILGLANDQIIPSETAKIYDKM